VSGEAGIYGKAKGNTASKEVNGHLEAYAPAVRRLAELEVAAQASFWSLKRKFAGAA
jgi:ATP-dependent RNA helicase DDX1